MNPCAGGKYDHIGTSSAKYKLCITTIMGYKTLDSFMDRLVPFSHPKFQETVYWLLLEALAFFNLDI